MRADSEIERVNETGFDKMKKEKRSKLYRSELEVDGSAMTVCLRGEMIVSLRE